MRDILFQGKRRDNGEWVGGKGAYSHYDAFILVYEHDSSTGASCVDDFDIVPDTLSEYTGRKDIHDDKIFENHIVKSNFSGTEKYYKVIFKDGAFGLSWIHNDVEHFAPFTSIIDSIQYEIVGNVFDNPELLE